jgi:O-antigen ligase
MIAIVLTAALVGMIWGALALLRGPLLFGCLAFLLVGASFGPDFFSFSVGPAVMSLDRVGLVALVGMFIVQRRFGRTDPKPMTKVEWLLVALVVCLAGGMLAHDFRLKFPGSVPPAWRLLAGYLIPVTIYWIARQSPLNERSLRPIEITLVVFGLYLAVTGICEVAQQWAFVFPKHIANPKAGIHFGRARGPMVTAVSYGVYLSVCMLATWMFWRRSGPLGKILILAGQPLFLAGVYLSYTRSVWLGAALGLVIVLALTLRGSVRKWVLAGAIAASLLVSVTKLDSIINLKRETSGADSRDSTAMRASFTYVSWQMFKDNPLLGVGFGHFHRGKLPYLDDHSVDLELQKIRSLVHHNTLLSLLVETGLLGLGLFLAVLAGFIGNAWRILRSEHSPEFARRYAVLLLGTLGVYIWQLLFHELSYSPLDSSLVFFLAGITAGLQPLAYAPAVETGFAEQDLLTAAP